MFGTVSELILPFRGHCSSVSKTCLFLEGSLHYFFYILSGAEENYKQKNTLLRFLLNKCKTKKNFYLSLRNIQSCPSIYICVVINKTQYQFIRF